MDIESAKSKEVSKYYTCTNLKSSVILYDDSYAWYIGTMLFQFYNTSIILYSKIAIFELNARKPILSHVYFIWKYHSNNSNKMQVKGFSNFSSNDCHVIFFLHLYVCPYINFQKICCKAIPVLSMFSVGLVLKHEIEKKKNHTYTCTCLYPKNCTCTLSFKIQWLCFTLSAKDRDIFVTI